MSNLNKLISKLEQFATLNSKLEGDHLTIFPETNSGFSVWITGADGIYTVGYDGWHEEFDDEAEAFSAVLFGLTSECRLKVIKRGETECSWQVESLVDSAWIEESLTGMLFIPFWRRKVIEYRQNNQIDHTKLV